MKLSKTFDYEKIIFVGAGGTGGYLIPMVLRYFNNNPIVSKLIKFEIVDPDIVENKNIVRQNFINEDIGKYKAEVLARRYSSVFNIDIDYSISTVQERFNTKDLITQRDLSFGVGPSLKKILIVDSVDNNRARLYIDTFIKNHAKNTSWISIGNDDKFGNLVFYDANENERRSPVDIWPNDFSPEALNAEDEHELENACAIVANDDPQNLAINLNAAIQGVSFIYSLISGEYSNQDVILFDRFGHSKTIERGYTLGAYIGKSEKDKKDNIKSELEKILFENKKEDDLKEIELIIPPQEIQVFEDGAKLFKDQNNVYTLKTDNDQYTALIYELDDEYKLLSFFLPNSIEYIVLHNSLRAYRYSKKDEKFVLPIIFNSDYYKIFFNVFLSNAEKFFTVSDRISLTEKIYYNIEDGKFYINHEDATEEIPSPSFYIEKKITNEEFFVLLNSDISISTYMELLEIFDQPTVVRQFKIITE